MLDLCFIRPAEDGPAFFAGIEAEMKALFKERATWYLDNKTDGGLHISVVSVNGLAHWESEHEAIAYVESKMTSDCWNWLQGYKVQVEPKEDVGPCERRRGYAAGNDPAGRALHLA